jgi:hypothetical protein
MDGDLHFFSVVVVAKASAERNSSGAFPYPRSARSIFLRLGPAFFTARFTLAFDFRVFFASYRTS